ncbi:MAG: hypothetical protein QG637_155, partial [Chloroflexota bacterium]|nr:hypothetical protein [Chloroflexota bacterium]
MSHKLRLVFLLSLFILGSVASASHGLGDQPALARGAPDTVAQDAILRYHLRAQDTPTATPAPTITPTLCPRGTPEPLWVEP